MLNEQAECKSEYREGVLYTSICGEIDHHTAASVREKIDRDMLKHRPKRLVIDLGQVGFMDSSGLGLILGRSAVAEEIGASVELYNVGKRIMKILSMAGVDRIANIRISKKGDN